MAQQRIRETVGMTTTHLRNHYQRVMPNKRHHRVLVWASFLSVVSIICVQLLYPTNTTLPFARVGSRLVGMQQTDTLMTNLATSFQQSEQIVAVSPSRYIRVATAKTGAEIQVESIARRLSEYPLWMRYIPFSLVVYQPHEKTIAVEYTPKIVNEFAEQAARLLTTEPRNAQLALRDGKLVATADTDGFTVDAGVVKNALIAAPVRLDHTTYVFVEPKKTKAHTTTHDLSAVQSAAETALARQVVIRVGDQSFSPSREAIAQWLSIDRSDDGTLALSVNRSHVSEYLDSITASVAIKPGTTNVTIVNGNETARSEGTVGKRIPVEQLTESIASQILSTTESQIILTTELVDVPPIITYNNSYTASQEGLQSYVTEAARTKNANIVVQQLDGPGWRAAADENLSTVSASTYKLYVSLYLFDQMDKGRIHWDDAMLDTTVSGCFDRMTIASTNPCAEGWLQTWGRSTVNDFVYNRGFSRGTTFTDPTATHTTATDLAKFMVGLEDGSLIQGAKRDRLLHSLRVHPYRSGVPTGSAGEVWDKVGFLWDYVHDAAIVHHPKGRYVIVVMTKGRSYATIAGITRDVERILYP